MMKHITNTFIIPDSVTEYGKEFLYISQILYGTMV